LSVAVLMLAAGLRLWRIAELPPGLHHDEAFHLLSAEQIASGQALPVYITGNQGNEPLYAYLVSISLDILGPVSWAGRLVAAWVGILAVALTIRAGSEMFPGRGVGLAAGLVMAGWYWPLAMSRWGSQPILSAAAAAAAMAGLWRGLRTGSRWAYALGGLSLAAGLWAYAVFRLFPLVLVVAVVVYWVARKAARRQVALGALLAAFVAALIYAPLGLFFLRNPQWFFNRYSQVTQVSGGASGAQRLMDNTRLELAGLVLPGAGDQDWRQNLPGRPALDLVQIGLFGVGLALLAWRRSRWPQGITLLAWFAVGLSISVLTEFPPQSGRSVMATPAGALMMGAGLAGLWRWAGRQHLPLPQNPGLAGAGAQGLLAAALALSLASTVTDYFVRWANDPNLFIAFDTGLQWMAAQLRTAAPGTRLFETPVDRGYPTFEFTLGAEPYQRFETFNGRECFLVPGAALEPTDVAVIVSQDSSTVPALRAAYPDARLIGSISPNGAPYAVVYQVPAGATAHIALSQPREVVYAGSLYLLGDSLPGAPIRAGSVLTLQLAWRLALPTAADWTRFVHLIGPARADGSTIYAQRDSAPCDNSVRTWQWRGEEMVETVRVDVPADVPAGSYQVFTGWYDSGTQQRLPATDLAGKALGDTVPLGTVQVTQ